ncbi:ACT domain-containing protein [Bacillota bacterium LX-D]|nr:ACT domain-containing protein [Bacillota bacterium LX-D]
MKIKQISVFLENKSGRLASVTKTLAQNNINIRALSIADTSDFGILRLIVDQPEFAYQKLKANGFTVSETEVIGVAMPDEPGGLAKVLQELEESEINIEYLYAFLSKSHENALVIFRVENIDEAIVKLTDKGLKVLPGDQIYKL